MGPKNERKEIKEFDDIFYFTGEFGKYQIMLFLLMIPFSYFFAFIYMGQLFMINIPDNYHCKTPELNFPTEGPNPLIPIDKSTGTLEMCYMYDVNVDEITVNDLPTLNKSAIKSCDNGYEFEFTEFPYETISTELGWVCDKAAAGTQTQAMFYGGAIFGGFLFGYIADRFGRQPALVICNCIGGIGGLLTAYSNSFWTFGISRFIVGFAYDNCYTLMYIIVLEYVGPKWRTFISNISIAFFFGSAACSLPWIAYFIADWRTFAITISVPCFLALLAPFIVPESARWLLSKGKNERAIVITKRLARVNGKPLDDAMLIKLSTNERTSGTSGNDHYSILDLFKSSRLRKKTIILIVMWILMTIVFDGHIRSLDVLKMDYFITFTIASATEIPSALVLTVTLDRWGRRWITFGTMLCCCIFSLLAAFFTNSLHRTISAIIARFFINIAYNIGMQYAAELLPTVIRGQGVAFIHIMGYVGAIASPFITYSAAFLEELPLIILGCASFFGGIIVLYLPETLGQALPQTIKDGEEFGKSQKFWSMPCLQGESNDEDKE